MRQKSIRQPGSLDRFLLTCPVLINTVARMPQVERSSSSLADEEGDGQRLML